MLDDRINECVDKLQLLKFTFISHWETNWWIDWIVLSICVRRTKQVNTSLNYNKTNIYFQVHKEGIVKHIENIMEGENLPAIQKKSIVSLHH